jgi:hypothetical protein
LEKPLRKLIVGSIAALSLAASANAESHAKKEGKAPDAVEVKATGKKGQAAASRTIKLTAKVKAVDPATRAITLEGKDGKVEVVKAGPEVKRFDEIAVGDTVVVVFEQGLLLEYQPPGSETVQPTVAAGGGRADATQAPGAAVAGAVQATVTVTAIDLKTRMVVFQGPQGNLYQVKAGPKIQLDKLKVGDKLLATYAEALAVKLEKAKPAKAPAAAEKTKK